MNKINYILGNKILINDDTKEYNLYTWGSNGDNIYQLDVVEFFYEKIPKNEEVTIIDIGAQSGVFTLLAKFLPKSTWYSFEPDKFNHDLLLDNIKINNIKNVNTYTTAISNTIGNGILNVNKNHRGLNTLGKNLKRFTEDNAEKHIVDITTIDNLFYNTKIDFIKIDTEGAEYDILSGAMNTIEKYKPKILMEYYDENLQQFSKNIQQLDQLISDMGYTITQKCDDNIMIEFI